MSAGQFWASAVILWFLASAVIGIFVGKIFKWSNGEFDNVNRNTRGREQQRREYGK